MSSAKFLFVLLSLFVCNSVAANDQSWEYTLNFDGIDDYVEIPFFSQHDLFNDFTVELRAHPLGGGPSCLLSKIITNGCGEEDSESYAIHLDSTAHIAFITNISSSGIPCETHDGLASSSTASNKWSHIAVRFEAATSSKTVFLNGQPVFEESGIGGVGYDGRPLYFGAFLDRNGAIHLPFAGSLSEIRIWDRARSQPEIEAAMNIPLIGNEPGLVGLWHCNEGEGTVLFDSTSHGANGTIYGASWGPVPVQDSSWGNLKALYR